MALNLQDLVRCAAVIPFAAFCGCVYLGSNRDWSFTPRVVTTLACVLYGWCANVVLGQNPDDVLYWLHIPFIGGYVWFYMLMSYVAAQCRPQPPAEPETFLPDCESHYCTKP